MEDMEEFKNEFKEMRVKLSDLTTEIRVLSSRIPDLASHIEMQQRLNHVEEALKTAVMQSEFKPIRMFVYGIITLCLTAVGGGLITLVVK